MTAGTNVLEGAIDRAHSEIAGEGIVDVLRLLASVPSPFGEERALAEAVVAWGRRTAADVTWEIDAIDERSASVVARSAHGTAARELAVYGHLDTSLTGSIERDHDITGTETPPPALAVSEDEIRGFGVGVAKAPTAAGIVAFLAASRALRASGVAHRLTLLLAAGGTHRAIPGASDAGFGRGALHLLARGWRPDAVLNVKAGPRGVLHEEPVAVYLRVRVRARWDAVLARRAVAPDGGLLRHAGAVIEAIESWRTRYLAEHPSHGQLAPEIAIGAIRGGSPEKPDLLAGSLELFVYAVLLPGEDARVVASDLAAAIAPRIAALPRGPRVDVDVYASAPGGIAEGASDIVRIAQAAWRSAFGDTPAVRDWSGATDGAIFLARGIPTARMGPHVTRDPDDPRAEIVSLAELTSAARAYAETAVRYAGGAS